MLNKEDQNSLKYKITASILRQLLVKNVISEDEMDEIDKLNRISYNQIPVESCGNL